MAPEDANSDNSARDRTSPAELSRVWAGVATLAKGRLAGLGGRESMDPNRLSSLSSRTEALESTVAQRQSQNAGQGSRWNVLESLIQSPGPESSPLCRP